MKKLNQLTTQALFSLSAKVYVAVATFLFSVVITRFYSPEAAGDFFFALSIVTVLSVLTCVGFGEYLIKQTAIDREYGAQLLSKVLLLVFGINLLLLALVYAAKMFLPAWFLQNFPIDPLYLFAVFPAAACVLFANTLIGSSAVASGTLVRLGVSQTLLIVLIVCLSKYANKNISLVNLYLLSWLGAFLIAFFLICRKALFAASLNVVNSYELKDAAPFAFAAGFFILLKWLPQILLGATGQNAEVAFFTAAERASALIAFVLVALNAVAAPKFAQHYKNDDLASLEKLSFWVVKMSLLIAIPAFLIYLFFSEFIMSIFGEEYRQYGYLLLIISCAQLVNVLSGSVFNILAMSGHQKQIMYIMGSVLLVSLVVGAILVPKYGVLGATILFVIILSMQNILAAYFVKKKLGFWVLKFDFLSFR